MRTTSSPVAPVLSYSAPAEPAGKPRRRWFWMVLSLPALVVPFVPFACDASPAGLLTDAPHRYSQLDRESVMLILIALPLVLGAATALWRIRVLWKPATPAESIIGHTLGIMMAACAVALLVQMAMDPKGMDPPAVLTLGLPALLLLIAVVICIKRRRRWTADDAALASLIGGYLPAALLALLVFWKDRQLGWYLTISPVAAALIEFFLLSRFASSRLSPLSDP